VGPAAARRGCEGVVNSLGAKALFDAEVKLLGDRLLEGRGWVVHRRDFPVLDISFRGDGHQELRLELSFDDWPDSPPSAIYRAAGGGTLAPFPPRRDGNNIFHDSHHPTLGRPFICMPGIREYHTHQNHMNDAWSKYRGLPDYSLGGILDQLWHAWRRFWP